MKTAPLAALALLAACGTPTYAAPAPQPRAQPAPVAEAETPEPPERAPMDAHVVITDPTASAVVISQFFPLVHGSAEAPLRPDAEGCLVIPRTTSDEENIVLLWAPGRAARQYELPDEPGEHRVELAPATALRARIADHRGQVDEVWLQATDPEAPWPYFVRADVDERGRVRVEGIAAGEYRVSAIATGGAPVLGAGTDGAVRFETDDSGAIPVPREHRFLERTIVADGAEHALRVVFGQATVTGRVVDEAGAPIAGATVETLSNDNVRAEATADANGRFSVAVPPGPYVYVSAAHPDYGLQWTDYQWTGWRHNDAIPEGPITLTLRRGHVLRGRLVDAAGAPVANHRLIMIPAYIGSGPATLTARTDARGRFAFERCQLTSYELVPDALRNWMPRETGTFARIASADPEAWARAAEAGRSVDLVLERFVRVPVTVDVSALRAREVQVWLRWGASSMMGNAERVRDGRIRIALERGVEHRLWVRRHEDGDPLHAPWPEHEPDWTGTPTGPTELTITP